MIIDGHYPRATLAALSSQTASHTGGPPRRLTRREARSATSGGAEPLALVPVRVEDERAPAAPVAAAGPVGRMEIVLAAGDRILVGADVDAAALARVVKALSRR
jgi:polygalacturonase